MAKKVPHPTDKHVGNRVRMRRMMLSLSQEKLGDGLGLTFQQVQKYEKGTNRIGASRLQQIAKILQVPVSFFYEGLTENNASPATDARQALIDAFLTTRDGQAIALNFADIPAKLRGHIADTIAATAQQFRLQRQQAVKRAA